MNGRLRAVQVLLAAVFAGAGAAKPAFDKDRLREPVPWAGE